VEAGPKGDGCSKYNGKGSQCKKQKGVCEWIGKMEWDPNGKCVPVQKEISIANAFSNEEKVGVEHHPDARFFKVFALVFCLLSMTICMGKIMFPKENVTYKELSQSLAEI